MGQVREADVQPVGMLIGEPVANPAGEDLGNIEEIMIDLGDGVIAYAVMSFEKASEGGDHLIALPWRCLRYDSDNDRFILDADLQRLAEAPGFGRGEWPKMGDRGWGEKIHRFYGQVPYWQQEYFGGKPAGPTQMGGEKKPSPFHH